MHASGNQIISFTCNISTASQCTWNVLPCFTFHDMLCNVFQYIVCKICTNIVKRVLNTSLLVWLWCWQSQCSCMYWAHAYVWVWVNSCTEMPCSCLKDRVKNASPPEGASKPSTEESSEKGKSSSSSATASGPNSGFTLGRPQAAKGRIPEADILLSPGESQHNTPPLLLLPPSPSPTPPPPQSLLMLTGVLMPR